MELLNEKRQAELLAQPESGMGYQTVEVVLRDGKSLRGIVFNSEYLLHSRLDRMGEEIVELKVVPNDMPAPSRVRESSESQTASSGASEALKEKLKKTEKFKRFCAFANDRRVTAAGGLLPDTYATTAADAKQVNTGSDAVRRYALPNPMPAVNVFTINPPTGTILKRGVVQRAYGQPGGGVEVIFVNGSPPQTVTRSKQIPPLP